jgi:hypothetical protein
MRSASILPATAALLAATPAAAADAICGHYDGRPGVELHWCCDNFAETCCYGLWDNNQLVATWCD